jgi:hypothetical protein
MIDLHNPCILFRKTIREEAEFESAQKYFDVVTSRMECKNRLVIGRYSVLPMYRELEKDLRLNNCGLINTHDEHCWIADFAWYFSMHGMTPLSWDQESFWRCKSGGPFVVKGRTNSRKHKWSTHMFAETKRRAVEIADELRQDSMIGEQGIIFREYVPLKTLEVDHISGLPYSNEWRFFYYKTTRLSHGFYWSSSAEETISSATMTQEGLDFANRVAAVASEHTTFYVLDIAEKASGGWTLVEINDAQMSGLSENDPDTLYESLAGVFS